MTKLTVLMIFGLIGFTILVAMLLVEVSNAQQIDSPFEGVMDLKDTERGIPVREGHLRFWWEQVDVPKRVNQTDGYIMNVDGWPPQIAVENGIQ